MQTLPRPVIRVVDWIAERRIATLADLHQARPASPKRLAAVSVLLSATPSPFAWATLPVEMANSLRAGIYTIVDAAAAAGRLDELDNETMTALLLGTEKVTATRVLRALGVRTLEGLAARVVPLAGPVAMGYTVHERATALEARVAAWVQGLPAKAKSPTKPVAVAPDQLLPAKRTLNQWYRTLGHTLRAVHVPSVEQIHHLARLQKAWAVDGPSPEELLAAGEAPELNLPLLAEGDDQSDLLDEMVNLLRAGPLDQIDIDGIRSLLHTLGLSKDVERFLGRIERATAA